MSVSRTHNKVTTVRRVARSGQVTWYLRWRADDGRYKERRAHDNAVVRERERRRLQARLNTTTHAAPLEAAWLDHRQDLERKTVSQYLRALRRFIDLSGATHTWDVTRQALRDYRAGLADLDLEPRTKNSELARVAAVCNQLRRADLVPDLHRDDITDTLRRFKSRREPPQPYSVEFLHKLLQGVTEHDLEHARPARPLVEFALLSGMRRSEIFAMTPDWVDIDRGVICVPSMKTTRGRLVQLRVSPRLHEIAAKRISDVCRWTPAMGGKLLRKVEPRFTWQNLRATCGSYLVNAGILTPWRAARQLGHTEAVAEVHYWGSVTVAQGKITLEDAMGLAF